MKKTFAALAIAGAANAAMAIPAAAVDTVDMQPLSQAMTPQIQDCRPMDTLRVPMRTSGADLVPIYANDYEAETPSGSIFDKNGVQVDLQLENDLQSQIEAYMACDTPIMRVTQGMANLAAGLTEADPRTEQVAIYQHAWSNGADALVTRDNIQQVKDLSGATIALQAYGPHIDYMTRLLADGQKAVEKQGGTWQSPEIVYTPELLGVYGDTPAAAFLENKGIDAAFVTKSDANILTSGGNTGTGAEGSVKGAEILATTKTASRVISEVYVVRKDYFEANRAQVKSFVKALFSAEEKVREDVVKQIVEWDAVAGMLLEDETAVEDAKQLWRDVETTGLNGNVEWSGNQHPRSWKRVNNDIQAQLVELGLMQTTHALATAGWNHQSAFAGELFDQRRVDLPSFDQNATSSAVKSMQEDGNMQEKTLLDFEINFKPNQTDFPISEYKQQFNEVIDKVSTYGGAVLTVEGHSDPLKYLKMKHQGASVSSLRRVRKSAENLSYRRAAKVREAIMKAAEQQGLTLDESQFVTLGRGIESPKTGMCGNDPCAPQTKTEWLSNMRVVFNLVQMEAEESAFTPPNDWQ